MLGSILKNPHERGPRLGLPQVRGLLPAEEPARLPRHARPHDRQPADRLPQHRRSAAAARAVRGLGRAAVPERAEPRHADRGAHRALRPHRRAHVDHAPVDRQGADDRRDRLPRQPRSRHGPGKGRAADPVGRRKARHARLPLARRRADRLHGADRCAGRRRSHPLRHPHRLHRPRQAPGRLSEHRPDHPRRAHERREDRRSR